MDESKLGSAEKLLQYKSLLDDGIITQEEFERKKNEILGNKEAILYSDLMKKAESAATEKDYYELERAFRSIYTYKDALLQADKYKEKGDELFRERNYQEALAGFEKCENIDECEKRIKFLATSIGYKDSERLIEDYKAKLKQLIKKRKKKRAKITTLLLIVTALIIGIPTSYFMYFKPIVKYNSAKANMDKGEYYLAYLNLMETEGYRDSDKLIGECTEGLMKNLCSGSWEGTSKSYYESVKNYYGDMTSATCNDIFKVTFPKHTIKVWYEKKKTYSGGSGTLRSDFELELNPKMFKTLCKSSTKDKLIFDYSEVKVTDNETNKTSGFFFDRIIFALESNGRIKSVTIEKGSEIINLK